MSMVLTWDEALGVFDLLHVGHLEYLEQAKELGDFLIVGVNGDRSTYRLKGLGRPVVPVEERARMVAALDPVDVVVTFNQDTAEQLIDALRPDVYVKGGNWSEHRPPPESAVVTAYGGRVEYLTFVPGHSTTDLIQRILDNYQR
jgi:rfaE bifunctional protein nucleotidyltransferase chain/domain